MSHWAAEPFTEVVRGEGDRLIGGWGGVGQNEELSFGMTRGEDTVINKRVFQEQREVYSVSHLFTYLINKCVSKV